MIRMGTTSFKMADERAWTLHQIKTWSFCSSISTLRNCCSGKPVFRLLLHLYLFPRRFERFPFIKIAIQCEPQPHRMTYTRLGRGRRSFPMGWDSDRLMERLRGKSGIWAAGEGYFFKINLPTLKSFQIRGTEHHNSGRNFEVKDNPPKIQQGTF